MLLFLNKTVAKTSKYINYYVLFYLSYFFSITAFLPPSNLHIYYIHFLSHQPPLSFHIHWSIKLDGNGIRFFSFSGPFGRNPPCWISSSWCAAASAAPSFNRGDDDDELHEIIAQDENIAINNKCNSEMHRRRRQQKAHSNRLIFDLHPKSYQCGHEPLNLTKKKTGSCVKQCFVSLLKWISRWNEGLEEKNLVLGQNCGVQNNFRAKKRSILVIKKS